MAFNRTELFIVYLIVFVAHLVEFSYGFVFNSTVSSDGTGNFVRVSDAIAAAPNFSTTRFYIHVKPGVYKEHVEVPIQKTFIALIGDDASTTIIVDNRSHGTGFRTSSSGTIIVNGENFMAQFLTFQNSAGPNNGQAVALYDTAKYTSYYKCVFLGYQDTLYSEAVPTFFKECDIYGTVDFIFGNGLVVFQDCNVYARLLGVEITVTAQSKSSSETQTGFVFQNCNVTVSPEITSNRDTAIVYLGRPWRLYSTVVFMESFLDNVVQPQGWIKWLGVPTNVNLLFYAEFNNRGGGANTTQRVDWPGYHSFHNPGDVEKFTVENFINGTMWLPETGIQFRTGL